MNRKCGNIGIADMQFQSRSKDEDLRMIEPVVWSKPRWIGSAESPFEPRKSDRPLRITFHDAALKHLPLEDSEALGVLRELALANEVDALQTTPGRDPYMSIGAFELSDDYIPLSTTYPDADRGIDSFELRTPSRWHQLTMEQLGGNELSLEESETLFHHVITAAGHSTFDRDIFITSSPYLLSLRKHDVIRRFNPRMPRAAVKIVGLFLRSSQDSVRYQAASHPTHINRGMYYWVLARHLLPGMWRYHSACVRTRKWSDDVIGALSGSVLIRCQRSLEARDSIGELFYITQDNDVRDRIMYHFDYLFLIMAGMFDAQARIASMVYDMDTVPVGRIGFQRDDFRRRALQDYGAIALRKLVSQTENRAILTMVYSLRNTIHSAVFPTMAYVDAYQRFPDASYISIPDRYKVELWRSAEKCGSPGEWGLVKFFDEVWLEPYIFAVKAVGEALRLVDEIAIATEVERMFPDEESRKQIQISAPDEPPFTGAERERFGILG